MQDTISTTYNGWANRETWLVSLWLNNDSGLYEILGEAISGDESKFDRSEWLKSEILEEMYDIPLENSLWIDLLSTSLARVNWIEIVEDK
jgi:hypothetical protein